MGFWEEAHKVYFYTFLLFKNPMPILPYLHLPKAVTILIVPVRIKEMGAYSGLYYRKSFLPAWISLVGMDPSERPREE